MSKEIIFFLQSCPNSAALGSAYRARHAFLGGEDKLSFADAATSTTTSNDPTTSTTTLDAQATSTKTSSDETTSKTGTKTTSTKVEEPTLVCTPHKDAKTVSLKLIHLATVFLNNFFCCPIWLPLFHLFSSMSHSV